jgi:hypothetical protein
MKSRLLASSVSFIMVVAASLTLTLTGVTEAAPSKSVSDTTQFVGLMKKGVSSAYVATYAVSNYDFFSTGSITVANLPPRPGTKAPTNADGYSSDVEMSYVFRGKGGHIVQWIQDETRVSACVGGPFHSGNSSLQCSRPFQFIPSNGFAEEGVGFVPENVLQNFENFDSTFDARSSVVFTESSKRFGNLQCIRQAQVHVKDSERETTCLNRGGLLVSWMSHNPGGTIRVVLAKLSIHPTKEDFVTLKRPTKAMILPPF